MTLASNIESPGSLQWHSSKQSTLISRYGAESWFDCAGACQNSTHPRDVTRVAGSSSCSRAVAVAFWAMECSSLKNSTKVVATFLGGGQSVEKRC